MKVCELQENDGWYPMLLYGYRIRGLDNSSWGHVLVKNKKLIGKERKQMKKPLWKRLVSSVITGALFVSMVPISAIAADTDAGTVAGEAETVKVSSITASSRETNFNSDWKFYLGTSSTAQNKNFDDYRYLWFYNSLLFSKLFNYN